LHWEQYFFWLLFLPRENQKTAIEEFSPLANTVAIQNLSFSYDALLVFSGLTLTFSAHWTALAGPNGSGKSTLIKLLTGALKPDVGTITGGTVALCPQEMDDPPPFFTDPELLNDPALFPLLAKLDIGADWHERWQTLSGGERKRCIIADALLRKPEVLILDEPANHIDERTMDLLIRELRYFEGVGIIVSHNLAFLDALAAETALLVPQTVNNSPGGSIVAVYGTGPSVAFEEFAKEQTYLRGQKAVLGAEIGKLRREKDHAVRLVEQSRQRLSKKGLDIHDSDTRAKINLAMLSSRDREAGKRVTAIDTRLGMKQAESSRIQALGQRKSGAGLKGRRSEKNTLFYCPPGTEKIAGGTIALRHPSLEIAAVARIVITGDNGSGKTSFLEWVKDRVSLPEGAVWYLRQELSRNEGQAVAEKLSTLTPEERGRALSVVYRLGSEPASALSTGALSPGEARKLLFAFTMLEGVSLILLDEPINHLDTNGVTEAQSIQVISGTMLTVLEPIFFSAQSALENDLNKFTLQDLINTINNTFQAPRIHKKACDN
jgi:ATPase subunit of ABC transporter with duplicated ATPase domains